MNAALVMRMACLQTLLLAASAQAGSLCAAPPTPIDRRACEAARQGPDALRLFVQRMNWLRHNLDFFDYVDEATQMAWDRQRRDWRTSGIMTRPPTP